MTCRLRWRVFVACFCAVLSCGFAGPAIDGVAPALLSDWGILRFELAPLWSAAIYGVAAGALLGGPCADWLGHRKGLGAGLLLFGAASMASALSRGLDELALWRFVTGLGLGAIVPSAVALMSAHGPDRRRGLLTTSMLCGLPLGETCSRLLAPWIIPDWGWRGFLLLMGMLPLVLAVPVLLLPEPERSRAAIRTSGVRLVLSKRRVFGSAMLWVAAFMTLVTLDAFVAWLPILLRTAGVAARGAALLSVLLPLLGSGAILFGGLMDRFSGNLILAAGSAMIAGAVFAIGFAALPAGSLLILLPAAAALIHAVALSLPALASSFYPPTGRATGIGWMLGFGSLAGIGTPPLVTELMRRNLTFREIFAFVALPGVLAAVALLLKHWLAPEPRPSAAAAGSYQAEPRRTVTNDP